MAIQFAGSSSTGGRRRRRIVVNGEGMGVDSHLSDEDAAEIESELVASAAAGPWVPVSESRIWCFAAALALLLGAMTFAWARPSVFHSTLTPLATCLLSGTSPVLIVCVEFFFLALSAQLSHLISWYRSRGKLDFDGRYRFWPWATGLFALAAFGFATNSHRAVGDVAKDTELLAWRGETVVWLLPICIAALPIALFLDRDIRNNRSSLWTIRLSGVLWITEAWLEIFRPELQSQPWFAAAFLLIPLFASATLFVGLWFHARVVAYVCPDPPELNEKSAWSLLLDVFSYTTGMLMFWRRKTASVEEDETKPKRRRKKTETEEAATKRKKKPPAKRTVTRSRTRVKTSEEDPSEESTEASAFDDSTDDETASPNDPVDESSSKWQGDQYHAEESEQWDEEPVVEPVIRSAASRSKGNNQTTEIHKAHSSAPPAPHSRRQSSWEDESPAEEQNSTSSSDSSDESEEDRQFQLDSGMTADQMKGLSKRQKRELKKQMRDQERARGR